ncbi:protein aardvark [Anaeramoeba ignava]|uniref:Protein aardvark n=1 Tax=Anaeramoeba ignava TaxID=1746090 RepID=A0A9Q0LDL0_ANAIG|nr:protein aardvark [Anaeramoeba ignava]
MKPLIKKNNNNNNFQNLYQFNSEEMDDFLLKSASHDLFTIYSTQKKFSDFTIYCGKEKTPINCHKIILNSRSYFFHALTSQEEINDIHFLDFEYNVVEPIIKYLYKGKIEIKEENLEKSFEFADKIRLAKLKVKIEKEIEKRIDQTNMIFVFYRAKEIKSAHLSSVCQEMILKNISSLLQQNQIAALNQNAFLNLLELLISNLQWKKSEVIRDVIIQWVKNNQLKNQEFFTNEIQMNDDKFKTKKMVFDILIKLQQMQAIEESQIQQLTKHRIFPLEIFTDLINLKMVQFNQFFQAMEREYQEKKQREIEYNQNINILEENYSEQQIIQQDYQNYQNSENQQIIQQDYQNYQNSENQQIIQQDYQNYQNSENQQIQEIIPKEENVAQNLLANFRNKKLQNIQDQDMNPHEIVGIQTTIDLMNIFPSNPDIQEHACFILHYFSFENDEKQNEIRKFKGIESIIQAMIHFPNNLQIQSNSCLVLRSLSENEKNQLEIRKLRGIEFILKAMNNFPTNPFIQIQGCGALQNISVNRQNKIEIRNQNGIETIINAMRYFPNNEDVQIQGCWSLANLSLNKKNKIEIRNQNGIETIINAMRYFPNNEDVQENGCWSLKNLVLNEENRKLIQKLDIKVLIQTAMRKFSSNDYIQKKAKTLLLELQNEN